MLSVSFSNDVFTTAYDNYLLVYALSCSVDGQFFLRYRNAGTDDSSSNYSNQLVAINANSFFGSRNTLTVGNIGFLSPSGRNAGICQIFSPKLSTATVHRSLGISANLGSYIEDYGVVFSPTTSFDSLSVFKSSTGTMTGKVSLYGYKF